MAKGTKMEKEIEMEVFRVGDYGDRGNYGEADLEGIAKDYDPKLHEAPVTVDHKREGPAYGWVKGLKRVGDKLVAVIANMAEDLAEAVRGKRYRKISVELYRQMRETGRPYLRAVSFLGAKIPEVKGLAPVELGEENGDAVEIDFEEGTKRTEVTKGGGAGQIELKEGTKGTEMTKGGEEDMDEKEKKELEAKFAETDAKLKEAEAQKKAAEDKLKEAEAKFAEEERKRKEEGSRAGAKAWVDQKVHEGFVTPAQAKSGLAELLCFLDLQPEANVITFGEGEKAKPAEALKTILSQVKLITFEEVAKREPEKAGDVATFAEKAKAAGVTVAQYKKAGEEAKNAGGRFTPEQYIESNPGEFAR